MAETILTPAAVERVQAHLRAIAGCEDFIQAHDRVEAALRAIAGRDDVTVDFFRISCRPDGADLTYGVKNWPEPLAAVRLSGDDVERLLAAATETGPACSREAAAGRR